MTANADQISEWNGVLGQRWAAMQAEFDAFTGAFGEAALAAAKAQPGERALDIGCGCGTTSFALASSVGPTGSVLGVDISRPMLDVAEHQLRAQGLKQLSFREADASRADLAPDNDLIFSRFGVMFFDDPPAAFAHMRKALKPAGRLAFVCWAAPRDNPWAMAPLMGGRAALNHNPPPADAHAPGPFAFADPDRIHSILGGAGFTNIATERFEHVIPIGPTVKEAAINSARSGPLSRLIRDFGEARLPEIMAGVEKALTPLAAADGSVSLPGRTWIVTARAS